MYSIFIHKKAAKFLKSRSSSIKLIVKQKLESLREDPFTHPKLDIKKLKGQENVYRLRIGKIRIIYQVLEQDLLILVISAGGRGDVYKKKG
jgi:mRNA interferase RelE/StbE